MFGLANDAATRRSVFVEGHSEREATRVFGLARKTVAKMCRAREPGAQRPAKRLNRGGAVVLKAETYELARRYVPGIDIYTVEAEYKAWCQGKPRPTNPDGAFICEPACSSIPLSWLRRWLT
ncbi:MAG: hypothetical protein R3D57_16220 [Hyphomicrobiaceae bacterium]